MTDTHVPSPADQPDYFAEELVREAIKRGARVYRMREVGVFALMNDPEVARWLVNLGAKAYRPPFAETTLDAGGPIGAYRKAPDSPPEWDLWIHIIPVLGGESVWEAAGRVKVETVEATAFR